MQPTQVSVIGLGYIGLPTAAVIASRGVQVCGVDVSQETVDTINRGEIHIVEPDLDIVVRGAVTTETLRATCTPEPSDVFIVAVPTPFTDGHEPDLSFIESAANAIAPVLKEGDLIILESTSPVGATEKLCRWIAAARPDLRLPHEHPDDAQLFVAHCPERVLPGYVLQELVANDRVIGGITRRCAERARDLYKLFVKGECILTTARTAEMAKLTENAFRDVNIAFANELSLICDDSGIDVWELIELANLHPRVNILNPGPGVGGHCIAVDPWFIVSSNPEKARLIRTARTVNDSKPGFVVDKVVEAADQFKQPVIACLGLAFKANIDDLRESPALEICREVSRRGLGEVLAVEPNISALPASAADDGFELTHLEDALERANVVVILVDHDEFRSLDRKRMNTKLVVDTRGVL
ncbi:MAG: UDP-N-acetyl-D-mannosamine dehydrogenase [Planctomycetota bacterium]|jgi:UDP-N-acetyl-D-mannosaminuronic acid dehydrogenase